MEPITVFMLAFAIGVIDGLRSMTAPAVVSWAAHLKWINLNGSPFSFLGSTAAVWIFSVLAVMELVADKLPQTPNRTMPASLLIRCVLGGLSGAALCAAAHQSYAIGAALGAVGGLAGGFGGYEVRRRLSQALKAPFLTAILEDAVAIGCGFFIVSRFQSL